MENEKEDFVEYGFCLNMCYTNSHFHPDYQYTDSYDTLQKAHDALLNHIKENQAATGVDSNGRAYRISYTVVGFDEGDCVSDIFTITQEELPKLVSKLNRSKKIDNLLQV